MRTNERYSTQLGWSWLFCNGARWLAQPPSRLTVCYLTRKLGQMGSAERLRVQSNDFCGRHQIRGKLCASTTSTTRMHYPPKVAFFSLWDPSRSRNVLPILLALGEGRPRGRIRYSNAGGVNIKQVRGKTGGFGSVSLAIGGMFGCDLFCLGIQVQD